MWLGFFAWYRGLALGGTLRVSQVQLVQPFLAMLFAVPLLGERLDAGTVGFALAVVATVPWAASRHGPGTSPSPAVELPARSRARGPIRRPGERAERAMSRSRRARPGSSPAAPRP
jgi:hypothetical protein